MVGEQEGAHIAGPRQGRSAFCAVAAHLGTIVAGVIDFEQFEMGDWARVWVEAGRSAGARAVVAEGGEDGSAVGGHASAVAGVRAGEGAGSGEVGMGGGARLLADGAGGEVPRPDAA